MQGSDHSREISKRLGQLRTLMAQRGMAAYLVLSDDFHASEYVGEYFKCREYLSGFDGSAGSMVITATEAALWTDGRYFLQAEEQLEGTEIILQRSGEKDVPTIPEYLRQCLPSGAVIGYDGRTVSAAWGENLAKQLASCRFSYVTQEDLVGMIWKNRPPLSAEPIWQLDACYTGKTRAQKLEDVRKEMGKQKADACLIAALDEVAWLYNLRGADVAYTPVALSYTIVGKDYATLYINPEIVTEEIRQALEEDGVRIRPYFQVYEDVKCLTESTLLLDKRTVNTALAEALDPGVKLVDHSSPVVAAKAVKNPVEMENERLAHVKDGVAVTRLICWLKKMQREGRIRRREITELMVAEKLESFRREGEGYLYQSFAPIIATGEHGAIVHYEPTPDTDRPIQEDTFVLMDTGGHYLQGTTDITRTMAMGTLTRQQKEHYTAVLKGHLDLGAAHFKQGCTGVNLDYLARAPLWELGLDYNHGTGHGVGYLLNVHEGPNAVRSREANGTVGAVLEEGMIISNEPGLYLEHQYGIRIENLILCRKAEKTEYGQFMRFETLTMVPYDRDAILPELLSERQRGLLDQYHRQVYDTLEKHLDDEERRWLAEATAPV